MLKQFKTTRFLALLFLLYSFISWGQITATYNFSASGAVSGLDADPPIVIDANIAFKSKRNSGTSNPTINAGQLRLYQNTTKGGSIIIYASNGATITGLTVYASGSGGTGPAKYLVDTTSGTGTSVSYSSGKYTMTSLNATQLVEFYNVGSNNTTRTYIDKFEVTYSLPSTCTAPSSQSTSFSSANIGQTTAQVNWVRGNGDKVLVVGREGSAVNANPVNGTSYTADEMFGLGDEIGTGNFVVYNGTGTQVDLTDLMANKNYHFAIYEYNDTGLCYNLVSPLTGNFSTLAPAPALSSQTFTGNVGAAFNETPNNTGGPVTTWELVQGALPTGLSLNTTTGNITGIPTTVGTSVVDIKATNASGEDTKTYTFTINPAIANCFAEDFASISAGNNIDSNGSNSAWNGNTNFPTVDRAYQAGEAIKIGSGSNKGSITSKPLNTIGGTVTVSFDVKGWTNVEGNLIVTLGGVSQTVTYTAEMAYPFENKSVSFTNVPLGSTLKIETTAKRAFIDNVMISCGTLVTIWDASNTWTNGTPDNTKPVIIDADYTGTGFVAKDLLVKDGKNLTISSGYLESDGVENNGSIVVKEGANFIPIAYSGTGTYTQERTATAAADKYVFWSSPVVGQNMHSIYNPASTTVMTYNTATDYYDVVSNPSTSGFGIGYSVKAPVANAAVSFTGTPNLGAVNTPVVSTANANGNAYNLIGNPYTSNLDMQNFYLDNTTNVGETFYFWNPATGIQGQTGATAVENPGWALYNANSVTWSRAASGTNSIIPPGQGFIVKALTNTVVWNNGMRTHVATGVSSFNLDSTNKCNSI